MTTLVPNYILQGAIAGGYKEYEGYEDTIDWQVIALDPDFWMALGKEVGWMKDDYYIAGIPQGRHYIREAHRFYDLILRKASQEQINNFWQNI